MVSFQQWSTVFETPGTPQTSPTGADADGEYSSLLAESGAGTDGRVLTADDPFERMSHREIYDALAGVDPNQLRATAESWRTLALDARAAADEFATGVEQSIAEHWNGTSGAQAIAATRQFVTSFVRLAAALQLVGHGVGLMEGHLAQAKSAVAEPDVYVMGDTGLDALPSPNAVKEPTYRAEEAEEQARYVMINYYRPGAVDVDSKTPVLPAPSGRTEYGPLEQPKMPGGGADPSGSGTPDTPGPSTPVTPVPGEVPRAPDPGTAPQPTAPQAPGTHENPQGTAPPDAATTPSSVAPTAPQSVSPNPAGTATPGATVPGSGSPGQGPSGAPGVAAPSPGRSVPGASSPGRNVPGMSSPGRSAGGTAGPGRSVPGAPGRNVAGTGTPASASGRTGGAAPGRPGASGMGGMGGAHGKGEDDGEHSIPDYLVYDREDELLGRQPPALPPGGVIRPWPEPEEV